MVDFLPFHFIGHPGKFGIVLDFLAVRLGPQGIVDVGLDVDAPAEAVVDDRLGNFPGQGPGSQVLMAQGSRSRAPLYTTKGLMMPSSLA